MKDFSSEIVIRTTRSGGPGGQHVNKVETTAIAHWSIEKSAFFNAEEKQRIATVLSTYLNKEGIVLLKSNRARTQLENRLIVVQKMLRLVNEAAIPPKKRKPTRVPHFVIQHRREQKAQRSLKKQMRRKDW